MYQDYKDLLSAFHAHGVRYLIVGGYAVIFHAQPRFTKDIDVFIKADVANAQATYAALASCLPPASSRNSVPRPGIIFASRLAARSSEPEQVTHFGKELPSGRAGRKADGQDGPVGERQILQPVRIADVEWSSLKMSSRLARRARVWPGGASQTKTA